MPVYTFRHKETGEEKTETMKIAERDDFIKNNPDWEQLIVSATPQGDPLKLGITKPPSDFQKYVLAPIQEKYGKKQTNIGNRRYNIPREW